MADKEHKMSAAEIKKVEDEYVEQENRSKFYRERDRRVDEKLALLEKQNKALIDLLKETRQCCAKLKEEIKEKEKIQDDESSFEKELRLTTMLRKQEESRKLSSLKYRAEVIYTDFRLWCLATHPIIEDNQINMQRMVDERFGNAELFKQFCSLDNSLFEKDAFWIKKYIAEKYFGYSYEFNYDTSTWKAKKSIKV